MTGNSFNAADFRLSFPAFADITKFPEAVLATFWGDAYLITNERGFSCASPAKSARLLNLLAAHLVALNSIIASGDTPGQVTESRVADVSVTLQPPPSQSQFQYWLNLTPYGQQLLAILQTMTAGGFYFGGRPELSAFRKVGGQF